MTLVANKNQQQADVAALLQGLGALLTEGNVQSITTFLEEFSTRSLLPNLEARVRLLHQQVCITDPNPRSPESQSTSDPINVCNLHCSDAHCALGGPL